MKNLIVVPVFLIIAVFTSCRKVINVDLNASSPKYVIAGNITDQAGPYHVSITKTVNFDQNNNFPGVTNALVAITDITSNVADTLTEESPGNYITRSIIGKAGHTYNLKITSGSDIFLATSTLPAAVQLDSLYTEKAQFGKGLDVVPVFRDPVGAGNYFHLVLTVGDSTSPLIIIVDDGLVDGHKIRTPIYNNMKFTPGDSVSVELQSIDKGVFNYYSDLLQTQGQNSATPSNPQSNIIGGALGYFSAHSVNKKTVIVP